MPATIKRRVLSSATIALGATLLATTAAFATNPDPGDSRATAHSGNVTTCAAAGLPGETITSLGTPDQSGKYVTITAADVPDGDTLLAVVVKGGPAYNVYQGLSSWTMLHSPINRGGNIPTISHWFACVTKTTKTTTTKTTTTSTTTVSTTGTSTTTTTTGTSGGGTSTTTTTPGASGGSTVTTTPAVAVAPTSTNRTPGASNLAFTGFDGGWLVWTGALLLLAGAAAVALPRLARRRR